jgi:hypothetical protein
MRAPYAGEPRRRCRLVCTGSRTRRLSSSRCGRRAPGGNRCRLEMGPGLVLLRREHDRD